MKRCFAMLLAVLIVFSLGACNLIRKTDPTESTKSVLSGALIKATEDNNDPNTIQPTQAGGNGNIVQATVYKDTSDDETVLTTDDFDITVPNGYHLANDLLPEDSAVSTMITDRLNSVGLTFVKEQKSTFEGTYVQSVDDYLSVQHDNTPTGNASDIKTIDGMKYFEYTYENESLGLTYKYFTTATETTDQYWTMQGFCLESRYESMKEKFVKWLSSVKFK